MRLDELPLLSIEVSILSPPHPAASPEDFEPTEEGIYLTIANRTGCFLPQVARETGWTPAVATGCAWRSWASRRRPGAAPAQLDVFLVQVIGPEPFEKF